MKIKKKIKILALSLALLILAPKTSLAADSQVVGSDSQVKSYLIANQETGEIFYEKNADKAYPIASMSKLMTYLVVKEAIDSGKISLDQEVTVSKEAEELTAPGYSSLGIKEGDKFTVEELLQGLMVVSGNDCAMQLAQTVSKTEAKFVKLMNAKAKELGLSSQSFYNASGLQTDAGNQNTSSAKDLFKLSQTIIKKYPEILDYYKVRKIEYKENGIEKESTIPLVDTIKGIDGLKTGSTEEAGYCLTSTVNMEKIDENDKFRTIGIVMGADSHEVRNSVMTDLIYYVSKYYDTKEVLSTDVAAQTVKSNTTRQGYVELYPTKSLEFIVKDGENPVTKYSINESIKAPITAGEKLGSVEVTYDDQKYDVDLVAKNAQKEASLFTRLIRTIGDACDFMLKCIIAR